ncbi:MAG: CHASE4 domain-containing protein, partial [Opitutaceae bacterium]
MPDPLAARNHLSVKFALLVAAIFGVALAALLLVQRTQRQSLAGLLESETRERSGMMTRIVELTGQSLRDFTYDYAQWDDMVTFVAAPRREWAAINLDASLKNFNLAAAWVLRVDGSVVYATRGEKPQEAPPELPVAEAGLRSVLTAGKPASFFVSRPEGLFELCFAPVQPSSDTTRQTTPRGWLVAARLWGDAQLRLIADVVQCETELVPPGRDLPASLPNQIGLHYALRGPDGTLAANLLYTLRSHELEIVSRHQRIEFGLFAGTFVFAAIVAVGFVFLWIVRPLQALGHSLHAHDAGPMLPLLARGDEIGRVAQAVKTSFEQRAELEEMIEDRTRLGRELHDGVIQTVYAAGMSLAGARTILRKDPTDAERILEDTRTELNATVTSLRAFIQRLEPETLPPWTFRKAVQSIVTLMQGVRPLTSTLQIDDEPATALTGRQRLHLLQITREAVSNSVRHGQAQHILIRLTRGAASGVVLEITDDGIGLESAPKLDGGRGLANFAARAR